MLDEEEIDQSCNKLSSLVPITYTAIKPLVRSFARTLNSSIGLPTFLHVHLSGGEPLARRFDAVGEQCP